MSDEAIICEGICPFCEEPIVVRAKSKNIMVITQVVFDGWKYRKDTPYPKKKPGEMLVFHQICGLPDAPPAVRLTLVPKNETNT